jgi:hypothetical protein
VNELDDVLEISGESREERVAEERIERPKRRWILSTLLVLFFTLLGALTIFITWSVCFALIEHDALLYGFTLVMTFGAPTVLWWVICMLTRKAKQPKKGRVRLTSAIGFVIALVLSYVLLIPWVLFAIAFRDVRM